MEPPAPLPTGDSPPHPEPPKHPFGSNEVRLSGRQWLLAGAITTAVFWLVPLVWQRIEPLDRGTDTRIPYRLGEDYWVYERLCRAVAAEDRTILLGDSVIWGHYVSTEGTLSHYLNQQAGEPRYANLGVDGIHPAAMAGLVEHYGGAIRGKRVILFCNPLWMSSPTHDLRGEKERPINHPRLLPQFWQRPACYKELFDNRLGIVVQRNWAFLRWVHHLRIAYFDNNDVGAWALDHPYENPAAAVTLQLPSPDEPPSPPPAAEPWTARRIERYNPPWVDLETSLQWQSFQRTVEILRSRDNRVFVLVGPFNEHMLKPASLASYARLKAEIEAWLVEQGIPHWVPEVLPSELYADASHPLAAGYALLAGHLYENEAFTAFRTVAGGR